MPPRPNSTFIVDPELIPCPTCGGTGQSGPSVCDNCQGEGTIEDDPGVSSAAYEDESICYGCGREDLHDGPCIPDEVFEDPMGTPVCACGAVPGELCTCNKANEGFSFDKFMDRIVIEETATRRRDARADELTPQRKLARMYRERHQNRMVIGGRK